MLKHSNASEVQSELILASGSNRRAQLLKLLNLRYSIQVADVDERPLTDERPMQYARRIARCKALYVANRLTHYQAILAADTTITFKQEIIGKPEDAKHAKQILQKLSAYEHEVITGLCLKMKHRMFEIQVCSRVKFREISNAELNSYCLSDEPYDKAGAYAIQGAAAKFIDYVSGSFTNVMGLPLKEVCMLIKQIDV